MQAQAPTGFQGFLSPLHHFVPSSQAPASSSTRAQRRSSSGPRAPPAARESLAGAYAGSSLLRRGSRRGVLQARRGSARAMQRWRKGWRTGWSVLGVSLPDGQARARSGSHHLSVPCLTGLSGQGVPSRVHCTSVPLATCRGLYTLHSPCQVVQQLVPYQRNNLPVFLRLQVGVAALPSPQPAPCALLVGSSWSGWLQWRLPLRPHCFGPAGVAEGPHS